MRGMRQSPSSSRQQGLGGRGSSPSRRPRRHLHLRRALLRGERPCPRGLPALGSPDRLPRRRHRCQRHLLCLAYTLQTHNRDCTPRAAFFWGFITFLLPNSTAACVLWALNLLGLRLTASCCLQEGARLEPEPESEEHRTTSEPAAASQQQQPSSGAQQPPSSRQQPMNWAAMARTAADKPASESGGATRKPAAKKVRGTHLRSSAHIGSYTRAMWPWWNTCNLLALWCYCLACIGCSHLVVLPCCPAASSADIPVCRRQAVPPRCCTLSAEWVASAWLPHKGKLRNWSQGGGSL